MPTLPVTQMQFGDLILTFTTAYEERWKDHGSLAKNDVSFYEPIPPANFFVLGSIGLPNYDDPNGKVATMCVKAVDNPLIGRPPLAPPARWKQIWNSGGCGAKPASCWRPIPPEGYVALGDFFVEGLDDNLPPITTKVMCVAKELTIEGKIEGDTPIWNTFGSPVSIAFSAWQISASREYLATPSGTFAVNSFMGNRYSWAKPDKSNGNTDPDPVPIFNLRLSIPALESPRPVTPVLTSALQPSGTTDPTVDRVVIVPFTAVVDKNRDLKWIVEHSPFYRIQRVVQYTLLLFIDNTTGLDVQTNKKVLTSGVSVEQSNTFSLNTGVSVTYESGIQLGGLNTTASITLSIELGFSTTKTVSQFHSETEEGVLSVAPGHAGALWVESVTLKVVRADDTPVAEPLRFDTNADAYVFSEYPRNVTPQQTFFSQRRSRRRIS